MDDDARIRRTVGAGLRLEGFEVVPASGQPRCYTGAVTSSAAYQRFRSRGKGGVSSKPPPAAAWDDQQASREHILAPTSLLLTPRCVSAPQALSSSLDVAANAGHVGRVGVDRGPVGRLRAHT